MNQITGTTRLTGLLGHPVAHSISPMMHNKSFQKLGLDYAYLAFDVLPDQLEDTVKGLRAMNVRGFNLTMPHKTAICSFMDELTTASRLAGAVNTVINENGKLIGHTTDGIGYFSSLEKEAGFRVTGKKMTLLGAGGAANAILVQAALNDMKEISVFKRKNATFAAAESFCKNVATETGCSIHIFEMEDSHALKEEIASSDILTNATNVGMAPDIDRCLVDKSMLYPELFVSDIIYEPRETMLLSLAKNIGCQTQNGLYMLLYQGAASFECWTGCEMPISFIKETCYTK